MKMRVHKKENFITTKWSGGTTTQLFIAPEYADFTSRQFDFRISSAVVEVEESDFTKLSGFERKLMVLEGEITIDHLDHHAVALKPFDQDCFSGEWITKSKGKVIDFNVIYRPGMNVELLHKELAARQEYCLKTMGVMFLYLYKGSGSVEFSDVHEGDLLEINVSQNVIFTAFEKCSIVLVEWKNRI